MRTRCFTTVVTSALLVVAAPSIADHNSKNGEGTANMPNDIHNTRVETLATNDSESFRDFVKYGEGSKTINRFESEETQPNQANRRQGKANAAMNQGRTSARNQTRVDAQARNKGRARTEARTRLQPRAADRPRRDPSARSVRNRDKSSRGRKR